MAVKYECQGFEESSERGWAKFAVSDCAVNSMQGGVEMPGICSKQLTGACIVSLRRAA
jgi:hypothetical protein